MGQSDIKGVFFENPTKEFHIREIARLLKISKTAVSYHVKEMIKQGIVIVKKGVFKGFMANESSDNYRFNKLIYALERIHDSRLIDFLETQTTPKAVVLFGSFAKSEFDKASDIDLFIQAPEQSIGLDKFEKALKHKVHLLFEPDPKKMSPELWDNIINGIKLSGYLKVK